MSKWLKMVLSIFATLVLLIIIATIALPFLIDPNDYKPQIQAVVKDHTGRELDINGQLELSIFPWVGLTTGQLSLSNAQGFGDKPFAEIRESNIKVKLLPLLSKQIEVSRIVLKGLSLNLAKNKKGVANWDDLMAAKPDKEEPITEEKPKEGESTATDKLAALAIGGLSIENAQVVWDDQKSGKHVEVKDFNLTTEKLVFDEPMGVEMSLTVVNRDPQLIENIKFDTDLIINEKLDKITLNAFRLDSSTSGKNIPGQTLKATLQSDIALDLGKQTLDIAKLKLASGRINVSSDIIKGSQIKDKPVFTGSVNVRDFNLAKYLQDLGIAVPKMSDDKALQSLAVNFDLQAGTSSAALNNLSIKLDDSNIKGFVKVKDFSSSAVAFKLNLDQINADRYLAPKTKQEKNKSASTGSPSTAAAAGAALLPVDTLRSLNADGELTIGKLKINNLSMQGISLKLNAKNGLVKIRQSISQFYRGAYSGDTVINVKNKQPAITLNEKLSNVLVEPLLQDLQLQKEKSRLTGVVGANATLKGYGNTTRAIKASLDGSVNFSFKDGVVRGFNLQKMIDNTKALIEGSPLPTDNKNDQTVFSDISGSAKISNGVVKNDDLRALSSRLHVDGGGTANLVSEKLDYKITAKMIKKATEERPEQVKAVPLIIKIGGSFAKPSYTLDIPAMLLEKNKEKIEKKKQQVLKKLDEKLGPGAGDLIKGLFH